MENQSPEIEIDFNPELFNNVYFHLEEAFANEAIRFIWLYGGSSASKSFSAVQLIIKDMLCGTDNNALILRKYATDIRDSIYSDFKSIISDWGLHDYFTIQQNFIVCSTGSYVRFRGLDDSEKVKGISQFKRVVMEEMSQFDEVDLKQIRKRLRGRAGQQILGIFNPIVEEHWIKVNVFDKEKLIEVPCNVSGKWINDKGNMVILKTNYTDNKYIVGPHFVDQHVIDDFENDKRNDYAYYLVYGLGNWGKLRTGGEFWKDFDTNLHVKPVQWNEEQPIFLSWDENVNPYLTCLVWQWETIRDNNGDVTMKRAVQIDEICLEDPRNRIKHVCGEFKKRYPVDRVKGLFVGGDQTSIKEDTKKEKGENFFTDILFLLKEYHPKKKIQTINPSIVQSAGFVNEIYAGRFPKLEIIIGDRCKKSIYDYSYALEDSDGTLKKTKKKHAVTEVTFEEFGHCSDAKRYQITTFLAEEYRAYLKGGKSAHISMGKFHSKNSF